MVKRSKIEIGQMYGYWKVLEDSFNGKTLCFCTGCNNTKKLHLNGTLLRGKSQSCGCLKKVLMEESSLKNYGTKNPLSNSKIRQKAKESMIEKYGVEYSGESKDIQQKREITCLNKYGEKTNLLTKQHKDKTKQTSLEKYKTSHPLQNLSVRNRAKQTNLEKYGTEFYIQSQEGKDKIGQTCTEKYQVDNPLKAKEIREKGISTSLEKYGVEYYLNSKEFIKKKDKTMLEKYGVRHYSQTEKYRQEIRSKYRLLDDGNTIAELAKQYDINQTTLNNIYRDYGESAVFRYCDSYIGKRLFSTEVAMIDLLSDIFNIEKYDKYPIENPQIKYKPDFRIEHNGKILYLNIDGLYTHSLDGPTTKGRKSYHFDMRVTFNKSNLTFFQFREDELRDQSEIVKSIILNYFGIHKNKFDARKCQILKIDNKQAEVFFNENHLMKHHRAATSYGLIYNNQIVACMSIRRVKDGVEIARFGTLRHSSVRGGFSRLLKYIIREYDPNQVISFCDLRYTNGNSYFALNFQLDGTPTIGFKWTDKINTFNRLICRANMNGQKITEKEAAKQLNLQKIYDAGQAKFVKIIKTPSNK